MGHNPTTLLRIWFWVKQNWKTTSSKTASYIKLVDLTPTLALLQKEKSSLFEDLQEGLLSLPGQVDKGSWLVVTDQLVEFHKSKS